MITTWYDKAICYFCGFVVLVYAVVISMGIVTHYMGDDSIARFIGKYMVP